jgi:hypothetical protein
MAEVRAAKVRTLEVLSFEVCKGEVRVDTGVLTTPRVQVSTPFLSNATCSSFAMEATPRA